MNFGPCMCGDTRCPSCGPAQGNNRCSNCGRWEDDGGCEDLDACTVALVADDEAQAHQYELDRMFGKVAKQQGVDIPDMKLDDADYQRWNKMSAADLRAEVVK